jgi:phenylpyruvate tautomerase PptA (4-oxalocrotonate tautomerase family)
MQLKMPIIDVKLYDRRAAEEPQGVSPSNWGAAGKAQG